MNDRTAKVIKKENVFEEGANIPTTRTEYVCPCGKGKIVYESVGGFNDRWAFIECEECKKKYEIRLGYAHLWELQPKKQ